MAKTYPEVYLSENIKQVLEAKPPVPNKPTYPSRPKDQMGCYSFVAILCFVFTFVPFISDEYLRLEITTWTWIFSAILTFLLYWLTMHIYNTIKDKQWEKSYEVKHYYYLVAQWEKDVSALKSNASITSYRKRAYLLLDDFKFDQQVHSCNAGDARVGASEVYFKQYLYDNSTLTIYGPMCLGSYYPDIVLSSPDKRILFDIEIDEPYVLDTGKPIHYLDESGVSVLSYINSVINNISRGIDTIPESSPLPSEKKWTISEAVRKYEVGYRQSYLPADLQSEDTVPTTPYIPPSFTEDTDDIPF